MNNKEIRAEVRNLLAKGAAKSTVFAQLSGQGVKDSKLAYFIAAYADPIHCAQHERKVNILITIMFIQAVIAFLFGFGAGGKIGPNAQWIIAGFSALIPLLFAWGFYRHQVGAYNAYFFLSIIQIPKSIVGFASSPITTSIILGINIALLAYVLYIRKALFPDFAFMGPKKIKGEFVFT